jgi:hypothetical protein
MIVLGMIPLLIPLVTRVTTVALDSAMLFSCTPFPAPILLQPPICFGRKHNSTIQRVNCKRRLDRSAVSCQLPLRRSSGRRPSRGRFLLEHRIHDGEGLD